MSRTPEQIAEADFIRDRLARRIAYPEPSAHNIQPPKHANPTTTSVLQSLARIDNQLEECHLNALLEDYNDMTHSVTLLLRESEKDLANNSVTQLVSDSVVHGLFRMDTFSRRLVYYAENTEDHSAQLRAYGALDEFKYFLRQHLNLHETPHPHMDALMQYAIERTLGRPSPEREKMMPYFLFYRTDGQLESVSTVIARWKTKLDDKRTLAKMNKRLSLFQLQNRNEHIERPFYHCVLGYLNGLHQSEANEALYNPRKRSPRLNHIHGILLADLVTQVSKIRGLVIQRMRNVYKRTPNLLQWHQTKPKDRVLELYRHSASLAVRCYQAFRHLERLPLNNTFGEPLAVKRFDFSEMPQPFWNSAKFLAPAQGARLDLQPAKSLLGLLVKESARMTAAGTVSLFIDKLWEQSKGEDQGLLIRKIHQKLTKAWATVEDPFMSLVDVIKNFVIKFRDWTENQSYPGGWLASGGGQFYPDMRDVPVVFLRTGVEADPRMFHDAVSEIQYARVNVQNGVVTMDSIPVSLEQYENRACLFILHQEELQMNRTRIVSEVNDLFFIVDKAAETADTLNRVAVELAHTRTMWEELVSQIGRSAMSTVIRAGVNWGEADAKYAEGLETISELQAFEVGQHILTAGTTLVALIGLKKTAYIAAAVGVAGASVHDWSVGLITLTVASVIQLSYSQTRAALRKNMLEIYKSDEPLQEAGRKARVFFVDMLYGTVKQIGVFAWDLLQGSLYYLELILQGAAAIGGPDIGKPLETLLQITIRLPVLTYDLTWTAMLEFNHLEHLNTILWEQSRHVIGVHRRAIRLTPENRSIVKRRYQADLQEKGLDRTVEFIQRGMGKHHALFGITDPHVNTGTELLITETSVRAFTLRAQLDLRHANELTLSPSEADVKQIIVLLNEQVIACQQLARHLIYINEHDELLETYGWSDGWKRMYELEQQLFASMGGPVTRTISERLYALQQALFIESGEQFDVDIRTVKTEELPMSWAFKTLVENGKTRLDYLFRPFASRVLERTEDGQFRYHHEIRAYLFAVQAQLPIESLPDQRDEYQNRAQGLLLVQCIRATLVLRQKALDYLSATLGKLGRVRDPDEVREWNVFFGRTTSVLLHCLPALGHREPENLGVDPHAFLLRRDWALQFVLDTGTDRQLWLAKTHLHYERYPPALYTETERQTASVTQLVRRLMPKALVSESATLVYMMQRVPILVAPTSNYRLNRELAFVKSIQPLLMQTVDHVTYFYTQALEYTDVAITKHMETVTHDEIDKEYAQERESRLQQGFAHRTDVTEADIDLLASC